MRIEVLGDVGESHEVEEGSAQENVMNSVRQVPEVIAMKIWNTFLSG